MHALQVELQRVLAPADIEPISLQSGAQTGAQTGAKNIELPEVQLAVVGTFQGDCSVESLPEQGARTIQTRTLAESSVSNGHVLPYFRVDCARIIRTLAPALRPLNVPMRESMLGRALARAIAHELYHILAQTTGHDKSGIAKASLSMSDLFSSRFDFNPESLRRMQNPPSPRISKDVLAVLTRR